MRHRSLSQLFRDAPRSFRVAAEWVRHGKAIEDSAARRTADPGTRATILPARASSSASRDVAFLRHRKIVADMKMDIVDRKAILQEPEQPIDVGILICERDNNRMLPVDPPGSRAVSQLVPAPQRDPLRIGPWTPLVGVHTTAPKGHITHDPLEMRSQSRRRFNNRLANVHLPDVVKFDRHIDPNPGQPDQIVGRHDPEPAARDNQPATPVDIEAVAGLETLTPTGPVKLCRP